MQEMKKVENNDHAARVMLMADAPRARRAHGCDQCMMMISFLICHSCASLCLGQVGPAAAFACSIAMNEAGTARRQARARKC